VSSYSGIFKRFFPVLDGFLLYREAAGVLVFIKNIELSHFQFHLHTQTCNQEFGTGPGFPKEIQFLIPVLKIRFNSKSSSY
jgi:hypothetical protein